MRLREEEEEVKRWIELKKDPTIYYKNFSSFSWTLNNKFYSSGVARKSFKVVWDIFQTS